MQKMVINILFLILSFSLSAQEIIHDEALDRKLFEAINEYRGKKGLPAFIWNNKINDMAHHHSKYQALSMKDDCTHSERVKIKGIESLTSMKDRCRKYYGKEVSEIWENVGFSSETEDLVKEFLIMWIESPPHNRTLLEPGVIKGSVCININPALGAWATLNIVK